VTYFKIFPHFHGDTEKKHGNNCHPTGYLINRLTMLDWRLSKDGICTFPCQRVEYFWAPCGVNRQSSISLSFEKKKLNDHKI
jgi:hypothetical protein